MYSKEKLDVKARDTLQIQRLADGFNVPADLTDGEQWGGRIKKTLKVAGWRLEQDGHDNYSLLEAMKVCLSDFYFAQKRGDSRYAMFIPVSKKSNKPRNVNFASVYNCQSPRDVGTPIEKTEAGRVRPAAPGFYYCHNVYLCPVDAALIMSGRNEELHVIIDKAHKEGKGVAMLTLTAPHYSVMPLLECSGKMQAAWEYMTNSRGWKNGIKAPRLYFEHTKKNDGKAYSFNVGGWGLLYYSKSMETKVGGKNGWHNHFHILLIFDGWLSDIDLVVVEATIRRLWEKACEKVGLLGQSAKQRKDFRNHAVSLTKDFDADYLAKQSEEWKKARHVSDTWGAAEELTLGQCKKRSTPLSESEKGSMTVFEYVFHMCERARAGEYEGQEGLVKLRHDIDLIIEYGCAMWGRSSIQFSRGLRDWAGLVEKDDKQIAEEVREVARPICMMDNAQIKFIKSQMAYKPVKKALEINHEIAIPIINDWLTSCGFHPLWSAEDADLFIRGRAGLCAEDELSRLSLLVNTLHRIKDGREEITTVSSPASPAPPLFEQLNLGF